MMVIVHFKVDMKAGEELRLVQESALHAHASLVCAIVG